MSEAARLAGMRPASPDAASPAASPSRSPAQRRRGNARSDEEVVEEEAEEAQETLKTTMNALQQSHTAPPAHPAPPALLSRALHAGWDFRARVAVVGAAWSGKSTVFRRLAGELPQAADGTTNALGASEMLRVEYAGRRALAVLEDYAQLQVDGGDETAARLAAADAFVIVASLAEAFAAGTRIPGLVFKSKRLQLLQQQRQKQQEAQNQQQQAQKQPLPASSTAGNASRISTDSRPAQQTPPPPPSPAEYTVPDVLHQKTENTIRQWYALACAQRPPGQPPPPVLLVLTRRDTPPAQRVAEPSRLRQWARSVGAGVALVDLGDPHGVLTEPFRALVAKALPLDAYPIVRRGLLTKQGAWVRNWKVRRFVLQVPGLLAYYVDEDSDSGLEADEDSHHKPSGAEPEARGAIDVTRAIRALPASGRVGDERRMPGPRGKGLGL